MPKLVPPLTFAQVKSFRPKAKLYKKTDGAGLSLWIYPSGRKVWAFNYRIQGKQKVTYLGNYPSYSLIEAREWRDELRMQVDKGLPIENKKDKEQYIFSNVFEEWFKRWAPKRKSDKYIQQVYRAVKADIFPILENMDVRNIKSIHVVEALRAYETRDALAALEKIKSTVNLIFDYALSSGLIEINPSRLINTKQTFKNHQTEHYEALAPEQLPLLVKTLEDGTIPDNIRYAIYWLFLTVTRPIETVSAKWADINIEDRTWTIISETMKKSRTHVVPLSDAAILFLKKIRAINKKGVDLFEGRKRHKHLCVETPRSRLRRAKLPTTAHGIRALVGTMLEEAGYDRNLIHAV